MKKRILTLLLALLMALGLAACGGGTAGEPAEPEETETAEAAGTEETGEAETASAGEGSKLIAVCGSMDPEAGVHMNYDLYMASLDLTTNFDVQGKGSSYYERENTPGLEKYDKIRLLLDGTRYTLQIAEKTGSCMDISEYISDDIMMQCTVYGSMMVCKDRTDFIPGQAELNGQTYESETFPENADTGGELTFCFNEDGSLAGYILVSSLEDEPMEIVINVIDDQVDESLFDFSGYTITEDQL